ncbi:DUF2842 domain-containing protein [Tritonibacter horizontis]|uniref:DUF2842 domain-containing protein n=1 Tax=Tritonibacter horizontis TaxID=1768241 RepID=A0A132C3Y5_9RHOB|nr:DUF2842 domain-containing protein [Tritonibacter horizontis]KUP94717.1 hypothetical protein TRIHO_04110 [Tritonibacter horizontis]
MAEKDGLSYRARRTWALVILLLGMPLYIVLAVTILNLLGRPPLWLELLIYVGLGVAWVLPFKFVFRGVGKDDPDALHDEHSR